MAQLDEARTVADTPAAHVSDHNVLHRKANYVFDVMDYGATGDGVADDTAAFAAAADAAATAGGGIVSIPPGTFMVDTVQPPNGTVTYQGFGSRATILKHRVAAGPIVDLSLWTYSNSFRWYDTMGGFSVVGLGTDITEIGFNIARTDGEATTSLRIEDVSVRETGGEALYAKQLQLSVLRDCIFTRPDGIDGGHNVAYVELEECNGTRLLNCGFRSMVATADAATGMLRLTNSATRDGEKLTLRDCWVEYTHPTSVMIYCENSWVTFADWTFFDEGPGAAGVSWVHLAGIGNVWRSEIPGTYGATNPPYAGIKVSGSENRIEGIKGYSSGSTPNIVLEPGAEYNVILAGGQKWSNPYAPAMVDDNSGNTTNVLLDMTNGAATLAALDGGL